MTKPILVFGGAHIDRRGHIAGDTVMAASNPGRWFEEPGGGGFNAARALSRLGHPVRLIAPRGGDAAGEAVTLAAEAAGIDDRPVTFLDRATPSYTAVLDASGNLLVGIADMDLYRMFTPRRFRVRAVRDCLDDAGLVICDANLPADTLEALADATSSREVPLMAIAISPAKVVRLKGALDGIACLFMNAVEAAALCGDRPDDAREWPDRLRAIGLMGAVITDGRNPVIAYDAETVVRLTPPGVETIADVTGAGDAMASGVISGLLDGLSLGEALRTGAAASAITIRSPHAVAENLTTDLLNSQLHLVPEAEILE